MEQNLRARTLLQPLALREANPIQQTVLEQRLASVHSGYMLKRSIGAYFQIFTLNNSIGSPCISEVGHE